MNGGTLDPQSLLRKRQTQVPGLHPQLSGGSTMTASGGRDPGTEMGSEAQTLLGGEVIGHDLVRGPLGPLLGAPGPPGAGNGRPGRATCPHVTGRPSVKGHLGCGPAVCREGRGHSLPADDPSLGSRLGHFPLGIECQCAGLDRALGHLSLCYITANRERHHWKRVPVGQCHKNLLSGRVPGMVGVGAAERSKIELACTVVVAGDFPRLEAPSGVLLAEGLEAH